MKIDSIMTHNAVWVAPSLTLADAARQMKAEDVGLLPVGENDRLIGMLSDRDIVVNGVANGGDPRSTPVRDAMTTDVLYVYADQSVEEAAATMADNKVRRMPVLNRDKRLVGVVSLGDIAAHGAADAAGEALKDIAQ